MKPPRINILKKYIRVTAHKVEEIPDDGRWIYVFKWRENGIQYSTRFRGTNDDEAQREAQKLEAWLNGESQWFPEKIKKSRGIKTYLIKTRKTLSMDKKPKIADKYVEKSPETTLIKELVNRITDKIDQLELLEFLCKMVRKKETEQEKVKNEEETETICEYQNQGEGI